MNLLRAAGRALMGGYFIASGVKAVKDPDALVPATEPLAEKFVPFAQRTLPGSVSAYIPEDTRSLVRLGGISAVAGGVGMATGIAPRLGGALAAGSMLPQLAAADPRGALDKSAARSDFLAKLALAGAALVLTQDTRGKPSMLWRASDSTQRVSRSAAKALEGAGSDAQRLGRRAQKKLEKAATQAQRLIDAAAHEVKDVLR